MKTKVIATVIAGLGVAMMSVPVSAADKAKATKDTEVKKESLFEKGKKAVVDAAHSVADKSVEVYNVSKDATVETAEKVGDKSAEIYENAKDGTVKVSKNVFQKTKGFFNKLFGK